MAWQNSLIRFEGRPQSAPPYSWSKLVLSRGFPDVPDGMLCDISPAPGNTYSRYDWPPRQRGRGESLTSPRRIAAKFRTKRVIELRAQGLTWAAIARATGYKHASGPYRAMKRAVDRADWDTRRKAMLKGQHLSYSALLNARIGGV